MLESHLCSGGCYINPPPNTPRRRVVAVYPLCPGGRQRPSAGLRAPGGGCSAPVPAATPYPVVAFGVRAAATAWPWDRGCTGRAVWGSPEPGIASGGTRGARGSRRCPGPSGALQAPQPLSLQPPPSPFTPPVQRPAPSQLPISHSHQGRGEPGVVLLLLGWGRREPGSRGVLRHHHAREGSVQEGTSALGEIPPCGTGR